MWFQSSISRPSFNWISTFFLIRAFGKKLARVSSAQQCSAGRLGISKAGMPVTFLHDTNFPFVLWVTGFCTFSNWPQMLTSDEEDNVPLMQRAIEGMSCKRAERICVIWRDLVIETQNKMQCFAWVTCVHQKMAFKDQITIPKATFIKIGVHPKNLYLQVADEDLSLLKVIIKLSSKLTE